MQEGRINFWKVITKFIRTNFAITFQWHLRHAYIVLQSHLLQNPQKFHDLIQEFKPIPPRNFQSFQKRNF